MAKKGKTEPRKIPTQSRSRATVSAIVTAATHILEERGYDGMNVNEVAERAGASIGSLYQYFPSKEALVAAVADRLVEERLAIFNHDLAVIGQLPLPEAIASIVARSFEAFRHRPRLRRELFEGVPEVLPHFATPDFDVSLEWLIVEYLTLHREALAPRDLRVAVRILMTAVESVADRFGHDDSMSDETLIEETTQLVRRYLLR